MGLRRVVIIPIIIPIIMPAIRGEEEEEEAEFRSFLQKCQILTADLSTYTCI